MVEGSGGYAPDRDHIMVERVFSRVLGRRSNVGARLAAALLGAIVLSAVFGAGWAAVPVPTGQAAPSANVRDHGAVGDGSTNDTAAIQRANDAVAAAGGGTVLFPEGTFVAMGVKQDSNVHFVGTEGATLRHPDGTSNTPIVISRMTRTTGSIQAGSTTLSVTSTKRFLPGAVVGVRAAGAPSAVQVGTLTSSVTATTGDFVLDSASGWRVRSVNYMWVDEEIIGYTGMSGSTLLNVKRGLFGSTAADHQAGASVTQVQGLYALVTSIGPGTLELDRPADRGVTGADVWVGVVNASVSELTVDGNRVGGGSPSTDPVALNYAFSRSVRIENNTIRNAAHGAVTFDQGTRDSVIANNVLWDTGDAVQGSGAAVWLYRGAVSNTVQGNEIGGASNYGIAIDDRTEVSTEWDAPSDENLVERNTIDIPSVPGQAAVFVSGSNRNEVANNDFRSTKRGVTVARSTQGTNPGDSEGNSIHDNRLMSHSWGLHSTGSYNTFERNVITATEKPIVDSGVGNEYVANVIVATLDPLPSPTADPTPTAEPTPDATPAPAEEPPASPDPTPTVSTDPTPTPTPEPSAAPTKGRRKTPVGTTEQTALSGKLLLKRSR